MHVYPRVWLICLASLMVWAISSAPIGANPTIVLGTYNLQPNMANQKIMISGYGGDTVQDIAFDIQTGDGGYYSNGPSTHGATAANPYTAPPITTGNAGMNSVLAVNVEPTASSIFNSSNSNPQGPPNGPLTFGGADTVTPGTGYNTMIPVVPSPTPWVSQLWGVSISAFSNVTFGGPDAAHQQLLATVTIDTTGFFSGSYSITVLNAGNGATMMDGLSGPVTIIAPDGVINIVPEPSTVAIGMMGISLLLIRRSRTGLLA
jgi:hypothetical protein